MHELTYPVGQMLLPSIIDSSFLDSPKTSEEAKNANVHIVCISAIATAYQNK